MRLSGGGDDEVVGADCIFVRDAVSKRFLRRHADFRRLVPVTEEELFESMLAKLYRDLLNPRYVSPR